MSTWTSERNICKSCKGRVTIYPAQTLSFGHMPTCEYFSDKENFRNMWAAEIMEITQANGPEWHITWEDALKEVDEHGYGAVPLWKALSRLARERKSQELATKYFMGEG